MWGSYVVLGLRDHPESSPGLSPSKYTLGPDVPEPQDQGDKDPEQSNTQECRKWGLQPPGGGADCGKAGATARRPA